MNNAIDLTTKQRKIIADLLRRYLPNTAVWAYGSRVKWTSKPQSDLDMVVFASKTQKRAVSDLKEALEESSLPLRVDLFVWDEVPERFRKNIKDEHVVLQDKPPSDAIGRCSAMASEWRKMTLAEAGVALIDCVHKTPAAVDSGYPYIAIPQMTNGHLDYGAARRISRGDFGEWTKKARPESHDVVLSRRCNPGETAYVRGDVDFALGQNLVLLRSDGTTVCPPFLRWLARSPAWWNQINKFRNVGAVFDSLKCADVPKFRLPIPPLPVQQRIADILKSLDDKIELNRRMNRTLERMAAAIFKSWFIDFDPTRAKAEGRTPNLPAEIADLFPNTFEKSNIGPIPKGWKLKPIGEAVRCVGGATPSTKNQEFWDGGTHPFVTPKDMSSLQSPVILDAARHITDAGVEKISSKQLPVGTVVLSSRAPIGYLGVATVPVSVNQGVIAMICNCDLPNLYVLHWTTANMDLIKSRAGGTTFAEISKRNFRPIPALVPNKPSLEMFMSHVAPLHERITLNVRQNRRLADLRDTLLPKLLSGEIELPEADAVAEEVSS